MKKAASILFFFIFLLLADAAFGQSWKTYSDSGRSRNTRKQYDEAIDWYNRAKQVLEKDSVYSLAYSQVCTSIADIYNSSGQQKNVVPFYSDARKTIERISGKENSAYAGITDRLAQAYMSINPGDAEGYFIEAKELREKLFGKESLQYATSCNSLGIFYSRTGQFKKAERFHLEAKRIREQNLSKDDPDIARSYNNLADVYWNTGDYEKAESLALEARRMREINPGKFSREYAITCMNLGNIYRDMGQLEKAEDYYNAGRAIRDSLFAKANDDRLATLISLANLYSLMNRYEKAEPLYIEVRQITAEINKQSPAYALSCNNLGDLYTNMGKYQEAEGLLLEAKDIWNAVPGKQNSFHAYNRNSLGQLYFAMGQYKKAESCFLEARQLWEPLIGKQHAYYTQNTNSLAKVYWNTDQPLKADELYTQAAAAQYDLINKAFQFTSESEKGLFIKNIIGTSDEYYSFYYKRFPHNKAARPFAISLQNRNLILSSSQQMRQVLYSNNDSSAAKTFAGWIDLKRQLAHLYSLGTAKAEQIQQLQQEADDMEKELSKLSSAFKKFQHKTGWKEIRQELGNAEAAIEFISFHLYNGREWTDSILYAAMVLRKDMAEPLLVPLFEKKQLDDVRANQTTSDPSATINNLYSSAGLYDLVWMPIEKYLKGIHTVYYAPAGDLLRLSFAALPINAKTELSDKYRLIQLATTAAIEGKKETFLTASDKIQLYGGIEYDADTTALKKAASFFHHDHTISRSLPDDLVRGNSFQYLPGTMDEANNIKRQAAAMDIKASVLSGINASEESFDELNGRSSPAVLHIATHGFFFDDPANDKTTMMLANLEVSGKTFRLSDDPLFRSGLLFAGANYAWGGNAVTGIEDGIVTAYEVANMYLPNTKLVVLSACQTALGDVRGNEGVYGLQRAFKMAGVHNLIMSLWKVPDKETAEFMQEFYKNLLSKQSVGNAFSKAQNKMKNKYRSEPYKWAAWIWTR